MSQPKSETYRLSGRPAVALITNHGYPGVDIPFGGAPDTGGQNMYVNTLAQALDSLGYRVTIFARGGFPNFADSSTRKEPEYLSGYIRYVFVPGGGDEFIRKEDIAIALDEQTDWLDAFIRQEAAERGRPPWAVYEFFNTHYWDAAILGLRLIERWRSDVVAKVVGEVLEGAVPAEAIEAMRATCHRQSLGEAPIYHLGRILLENSGSPSVSWIERARIAATQLANQSDVTEEQAIKEIVGSVEETLSVSKDRMASALHDIVAADAVGAAVLRLFPERAKWLELDLDIVDRHVWTPHSLGSLKQENFRDQPPEVVRPLKFCERRSHERAISDRTRTFVATSSEIAERLRTRYRVAGDRIFYFPPCVDTDVFRPRRDDELESAYKYLSEISGVAIETLRAGLIVFETSRMDQTKRKDLILDAFADIAGQRDDVFLFIGGGPEKDLFRSLNARRQGNPILAKKAFLTGFIPEEFIGPLFSIADIYVSPSEMEGFGMSVSQAAASGCAVVASDLTPFAVQYVPDDALVVRAGDVQGFAWAIRRLVDDEQDRKRRADRLLEKVKDFEWKALTSTFLEHLRQRGFTIAHGRTGK